MNPLPPAPTPLPGLPELSALFPIPTRPDGSFEGYLAAPEAPRLPRRRADDPATGSMASLAAMGAMPAMPVPLLPPLPGLPVFPVARPGTEGPPPVDRVTADLTGPWGLDLGVRLTLVEATGAAFAAPALPVADPDPEILRWIEEELGKSAPLGLPDPANVPPSGAKKTDTRPGRGVEAAATRPVPATANPAQAVARETPSTSWTAPVDAARPAVVPRASGPVVARGLPLVDVLPHGAGAAPRDVEAPPEDDFSESPTVADHPLLLPADPDRAPRLVAGARTPTPRERVRRGGVGDVPAAAPSLDAAPADRVAEPRDVSVHPGSAAVRPMATSSESASSLPTDRSHEEDPSTTGPIPSGPVAPGVTAPFAEVRAASDPVEEAAAPRPEIPVSLPGRLRMAVSDREGAWEMDLHRHAGVMDLVLRGGDDLRLVVRDAWRELREAVTTPQAAAGQVSWQPAAPVAATPVPDTTPTHGDTSSMSHSGQPSDDPSGGQEFERWRSLVESRLDRRKEGANQSPEPGTAHILDRRL